MEVLEKHVRYNSLIELIERSNEVFYFTHDINHYFTYISPSVKHILGYDYSEMVGRKYEEFLFGHPSDHIVNQYTDEALAYGVQSPAYKAMMKHKKGHKVILEIVEFPIIENNNITGMQGIAINISEKDRLDEMISKADKLSKIGQLAAGVAHEIRNPLTSIQGFIQLMESEIGEQKFNKYFSVIQSELARVNSIVNEFLVLSKPNESILKSENIIDLLKQITDIFIPEANLKNISLSQFIDKDLPKVLCDGNEMKQVFINLLKNAAEAMPEGGEIKINVKKIIGFIELSFCDTGCGMSHEQIEKVGNPFYTTKQSGTGLGMMTCFRIIEKHQGLLDISSELNKGTTIKVLLPYKNNNL
jgi:PAS domain S-box-containing protein